jgi:hypothetical protein
MTDDDVKLLDAFRTIASLFSGPQAPAHDLILHTQTPDPDAVRRLCAGGKIPASKIGRNWWLKLADLEAYVDSHRASPKLKKVAPVKPDPADTVRELFPDRVVKKRA